MVGILVCSVFAESANEYARIANLPAILDDCGDCQSDTTGAPSSDPMTPITVTITQTCPYKLGYGYHIESQTYCDWNSDDGYTGCDSDFVETGIYFTCNPQISWPAVGNCIAAIISTAGAGAAILASDGALALAAGGTVTVGGGFWTLSGCGICTLRPCTKTETGPAYSEHAQTHGSYYSSSGY
jgi:hypothetical protein